MELHLSLRQLAPTPVGQPLGEALVQPLGLLVTQVLGQPLGLRLDRQ